MPHILVSSGKVGREFWPPHSPHCLSPEAAPSKACLGRARTLVLCGWDLAGEHREDAEDTMRCPPLGTEAEVTLAASAEG